MSRLILALMLATTPLAAQRSAAVDAIANRMLSAAGPGCAVGIRQHGEVVHRAGYGLADLERQVPLTTRSVFYTGSISKQFTAASIALAARDGVIDVDAPARRWLPELPAAAGDVTARELVHHTGGLREKWELLDLAGVPTATTLVTQQMLLDQVARQRGVLFPHGTKSSYSNTGYDLLATLLQRATGQSLREFSTRRIFAPLAMDHTFYADHFGELIPERALGYTREDSTWQHLPAMVETVGSGSLHSSVDDLLLWLAAWERDGGPWGDASFAEQLRTRGKLRDGTALDYGWGFGVDEWKGLPRVQHSGSLAGFRTAIWWLPTLEWSGVVLCNHAQAQPAGILAAVVGLQHPVVSGASVTEYIEAEIHVRRPEALLRQYPELAGEYWSDELGAGWSVTSSDSGYLVRRGSASAQLLRTRADSTEVRLGNRVLRFELDGQGRVAALVVGSGTAAGVRLVKATP